MRTTFYYILTQSAINSQAAELNIAVYLLRMLLNSVRCLVILNSLLIHMLRNVQFCSVTECINILRIHFKGQSTPVLPSSQVA